MTQVQLVVAVAVGTAVLTAALIGLGVLLFRRRSPEARVVIGSEAAPLAAAPAAGSQAVPAPPTAAPPPKAPEFKPVAVQFELGGVPAGKLRPVSGTKGNWTEVRDRRVTTAVESIVRGAPLTALGLQRAAGGLYHLQFTAEASRHIADGSWGLMSSAQGGFRANLIDAGGTVRGQGSLVQASQVAGAALAIWQVLAMVTAQKFLSDINKKLAVIVAILDDLKATLEEERRGRLLGNLRYLNQIANAIQAQAVSEDDARRFADQLEHIERECQQLELASAAAVDRHTLALAELPLTATWDFDGDVVKANENVDRYTSAAQETLLALRVRGAACQLRAALPAGTQSTLLRSRDILAAIEEAQRRQASYLGTLDRRIPDLKGEFTWDETDEREQARLKARASEVARTVGEAVEDLSAGARWLSEGLQRELQAPQPFHLIVAIGPSGQVQRVLAPGASLGAAAGG